MLIFKQSVGKINIFSAKGFQRGYIYFDEETKEHCSYALVKSVSEARDVLNKLIELNGATGKAGGNKGRNKKAESDTANTKPKRTKVGPKQDAAKRSSRGKQVVGKGKEKAPKKNV